MLSVVEQKRVEVSRRTAAKKKSQLGQFLTPATTALFMARLFQASSSRNCYLLDAGAGIGSLSSAFIEECMVGKLGLDKVALTTFELDTSLHGELEHSLSSYIDRLSFSYEVFGGDFIEEAVNRIQFGYGAGFTHAVLNPPYKKINSNSRHRLLLRRVGIETVNLYSAFVALALALMAPNGQLVAIIPRSFCNGPYYRPFREFMLSHAAIHHIHLFESRDKAFRDDAVLQENVIILLERDCAQGNVTVTTSTDDSFTDLVTHTYPFNRIVLNDAAERTIHVPTAYERSAIELSPAIGYSLHDLGISVSTGPVVDFRLRQHLRDMPEKGTIPLLYPAHFNGQETLWPKPDMKKPNAIHRNSETEKWLFPNGHYCVVRRFSSKEEKRRIVASVVRPETFANTDALGFENHLNVFHENKRGLPAALAHGLSIFLNTTAVDKNFRIFSGHTQVNATDLKLMKYPSRANLMSLGEWALTCGELTQAMIDQQLHNLTA